MHFRFVAMCLMAVAVALPALAGNLNPPGGPVAGTMKTLDEVEPRIIINNVNTPGDADSVFKISKSGSYYLISNIIITGPQSGIEIATNNVTIDLMGFSIVPLFGGSLDGITASSVNPTNLQISNGVILGCGGDGVNFKNARNSRLENLRVFANLGTGLNAGIDCEILNCMVLSNQFYGIIADESCVISNCVAKDNVLVGIFARGNCVISNCAAIGNTTSGIEAGAGNSVNICSASRNGGVGINAINGSTVSNCSADGNGSNGISISGGTAIACSSHNNANDGITGSEATITFCTTSRNFGDGIEVSSNCLVLNNKTEQNGLVQSVGAGIHATGNTNRIEGNSVNTSDSGIDVDGTGNIIIKNTASGNTINYSIAASNRYGVIIDASIPGTAAVSGSAAITTLPTTDPWANFSH